MQDREFARGNPATPASQGNLEAWADGPKSVDKLNERFDITGITALERLATGTISLVTPDAEKWQGLAIGDMMGGTVEASEGETLWLEKQRDYLFGVRYNPHSGWAIANQNAMRSMCAFGTGAYFIEEAYGARGQNDVAVPYKFHTLPLSENYFTVDGQGNIDQDYRRYTVSARAALGLFGSKLHPKTMEMASDPKKFHQPVEILHYIGYRQQKGYNNDPMARSLVESVYCEVREKHELSRGGFTYWPIPVYHWNQVAHSPYGESPVMLVMAEIKNANVFAKNAMLASQQITAPPVAMADDATMGKPNLNPRAINYGAIDAQGRLKIQPILTAQNPSLVREVLEASRYQIRDGLYTNLWQILINSNGMTATEALIRANEKGELLGPIGTKIQIGLAKCTDAELTILEGKGAWRPGAMLEPPQSLASRNIAPAFTSPLDRLRRANEVIGIQRTIEVVAPLIEGQPDILDNFDTDEIVKISQEVLGAPKRILKKREVVDEIRAARAQQQQIAQTIQATGAAGAAANEALPAVQMARDMMNGQPATGA